jgi:hypothetical protein
MFRHLPVRQNTELQNSQNRLGKRLAPLLGMSVRAGGPLFAVLLGGRALLQRARAARATSSGRERLGTNCRAPAR